MYLNIMWLLNNIREPQTCDSVVKWWNYLLKISGKYLSSMGFVWNHFGKKPLNVPCSPYRCWSPRRCKTPRRNPRCTESYTHAGPAAPWWSDAWWLAWSPDELTTETKNMQTRSGVFSLCLWTVSCCQLQQKIISTSFSL